ncbi:hypothetical protein LTS18_003487 [Coniosporium uncinatum]|uniref:Uncharacterized protein n=1 Tax=Coniosporium uncinatum TaxID=93489 RepID=A0ACC3D6S5_9PEZI|nr:hypothetical protein LTS18_003487 [Coniosporium uncinatum]
MQVSQPNNTGITNERDEGDRPNSPTAGDLTTLSYRRSDTLVISHEAFVDSPISDGDRRSYDSILSAYTDHTSASSVSYYSTHSKKYSTVTKKDASAFSPYQEQYDAHKPSPLRIRKVSFRKSTDGSRSPKTTQISHISQLAVQRPIASRAKSDSTIRLTPPSSRFAPPSTRDRTFLQSPASDLTNIPNSTPDLENPATTTTHTPTPLPEIPPKNPLRNTAYATHLTAFTTTLESHILSLRRLRASVLESARDCARDRDDGQTFLYSASASSNSSTTSLGRLLCGSSSSIGGGKSTAAAAGNGLLNPRTSVAASSVYSQLTTYELACEGDSRVGGGGWGAGVTPMPKSMSPSRFPVGFPIQLQLQLPTMQTTGAGRDKERDKMVRFSVPATEGRKEMSAEEKVERIRRGRLSGWVMKRFEPKRYGELAERALAEL